MSDYPVFRLGNKEAVRQTRALRDQAQQDFLNQYSAIVRVNISGKHKGSIHSPWRFRSYCKELHLPLHPWLCWQRASSSYYVELSIIGIMLSLYLCAVNCSFGLILSIRQEPVKKRSYKLLQMTEHKTS
jgi:hypothetical protein